MNKRSEFELIDVIRRSGQAVPEGLLVPIGDDCTAFEVPHRASVAVTTDLLLEGVHFNRRWTGPVLLGRKAVLVNVSDLAAVGAVPYGCQLGLGLPAELRGDFFNSFISGFVDECQRWSMTLLGGDLCKSDRLYLSVSAFGYCFQNIVRRGGGRLGDLVLIIGDLGMSRLGLEWLRDRDPQHLWKAASEQEIVSQIKEPGAAKWVTAHLLPQVFLRPALWLSKEGLVNSMIDVSDGLGNDLLHILEESNLAAELRLDQLPQPAGISCDSDRVFDLILNGGEDYALLFTASEEQFIRMKESLPGEFPDYRVIGRLIAGEPAVYLDTGHGRRQYVRKGFDHFA